MLVGSFALVMLLSIITGRITLLNHRSRYPNRRPLNVSNAVLDVISAVAGLAIWANIVWGFSTLSWYVALPIIVIAMLVGGVLPNPPRFEFFYRSERIIDISVVELTTWLWVWNWPY